MTVADVVSPGQVEITEKTNGHAVEAPKKSKAQLKAERRAKQEAQRAAKEATRVEKGLPSASNNKKPEPPAVSKPVVEKVEEKQHNNLYTVNPKILADNKKVQDKKKKQLNKEKVPMREDAQKKIEMFSHLNQYDHNTLPTNMLSFGPSSIHPAFVKLGVQCSKEIITGSNARCAALICAVKTIIEQYKCPKQREISRDLFPYLKPNISFLNQCSEMSVSQGNFVKHIKHLISHLDPELSEDKAKQKLLEECDIYFSENIWLAAKVISERATQRIENGDVILIYGISTLVIRILVDAKQMGKQFEVIVVDSRPNLTGIQSCEKLTATGIRCSYVYMNSVTYVMKETTKVLFAADALLANGYVLGAVGSAMIALIANTYNKPVIVCCETYKFSDRVQTDSILFNELADPDKLLESKTENNVLKDWRDIPSLKLLNLVYDATPPQFISIVITEVVELPCSSVPVILRCRASQER